MPPPASSFARRSVLSLAEAVMLAELRQYILLRSSQLVYVNDGGRLHALPRHPTYHAVRARRATMKRKRRLVQREARALPALYRSLIRRHIASLRKRLLNDVPMTVIARRAGLPMMRVRIALSGLRSRVALETAVRIADAAGVKVRTLHAYLRAVRHVRAHAMELP